MKTTKITILGDIMCEPLMLKAAKQQDGSYDFSDVFKHVKSFFRESDFVIGNLETPIAGEKAGFVRELFSFNAPLEFAMAAKEAGVSLVSTANNHCMDRGFDGLLATVKNLDRIALPHIGTYAVASQENKTVYREIDGQTIAVIAYTYGTNYSIHHRLLSRQQEQHINLLRPYTESVYLRQSGGKRSLINRAFNKALRSFKPENRAAIKKALGMEYNSPRQDDAMDPNIEAPYFEDFQNAILEAKNKADIVLFLPHVGGQFNPEPGAFTQAVIRAAYAAGADAIIASHPHIVQKAEMLGGVPCFYSIGNFSMSPNSVYLLHENLPDYGLAVNLYISDKRIKRASFSILKIIEKKNEMLTVWPVHELTDPNKDEIMRIYKAVVGEELCAPVIRPEYELIKSTLRKE